jgi:hypothetical protein
MNDIQFSKNLYDRFTSCISVLVLVLTRFVSVYTRQARSQNGKKSKLTPCLHATLRNSCGMTTQSSLRKF